MSGVFIDVKNRLNLINKDCLLMKMLLWSAGSNRLVVSK